MHGKHYPYAYIPEKNNTFLASEKGKQRGHCSSRKDRRENHTPVVISAVALERRQHETGRGTTVYLPWGLDVTPHALCIFPSPPSRADLGRRAEGGPHSRARLGGRGRASLSRRA